MKQIAYKRYSHNCAQNGSKTAQDCFLAFHRPMSAERMIAEWRYYCIISLYFTLVQVFIQQEASLCGLFKQVRRQCNIPCVIFDESQAFTVILSAPIALPVKGSVGSPHPHCLTTFC